MKYRMLTDEELELLEEDLKHFLISNGVDGDTWVKINEKNPEKAIKLIELFSDVVLQKVYEKIKFIEHRTDSSCMVFKLNEDKIELISINSKNPELSLKTPELIHQALVKSPDQLTMFKSDKHYTKNREIEIHEMLSQGCVNSSESFWILLEKVIEE